jgi:hypothetical protein
MKNNKDYFDLYSPLGDFAPRHGSTPTWKLALEQVGVYALLTVGLVASGEIIFSLISWVCQ